jgi:hypothetical protein
MAVNAPVVAAAATVTLAGTVRLALLLVKAMVAPPVGAGPLKEKAQALVPGPVKAIGAHARPVTVKGGTVTRPPIAEVVIGMAVGEAEDAFVTWIGLLRLKPEERIKTPVTTTPFGIVLELKPLSRQV